MTIVLRHALRPYAPQLVPLLVAVIERDASAQRVPSLTALGALEGFGAALPDYACLLVSPHPSHGTQWCAGLCHLPLIYLSNPRQVPPILSLIADAPPGSRSLHEAIASLNRLSCWLHLPAARLTPLLLDVFQADPFIEEDVQVRGPRCYELVMTYHHRQRLSKRFYSCSDPRP